MAKINQEQKNILLEFVEENENIARGKFTSTFGAKDAAALWNEVTTKLNTCGGATKSWKEWRKTWHDIKTFTKAKASALLREGGRTGGGPPLEDELTIFQRRVYSLIGTNAVLGHERTVESQVIVKKGTTVNTVSTPIKTTLPVSTFNTDDPSDHFLTLNTYSPSDSNTVIDTNDTTSIIPMKVTSTTTASTSYNCSLTMPTTDTPIHASTSTTFPTVTIIPSTDSPTTSSTAKSTPSRPTVALKKRLEKQGNQQNLVCVAEEMVEVERRKEERNKRKMEILERKLVLKEEQVALKRRKIELKEKQKCLSENLLTKLDDTLVMLGEILNKMEK